MGRRRPDGPASPAISRRRKEFRPARRRRRSPTPAAKRRRSKQAGSAWLKAPDKRGFNTAAHKPGMNSPRVPFLPPNDYLGSEAQAGPARRPLLLNRYDRSSPINGEAEVKYLDGDFRVTRPGAFVRCALTGVSIP